MKPRKTPIKVPKPKLGNVKRMFSAVSRQEPLKRYGKNAAQNDPSEFLNVGFELPGDKQWP